MKSINSALIIGAIASLFLIWNFRAIFGKKNKTTTKGATTTTSKPEKMMKTRMSSGGIASKMMGEAIAMEEEQTAMILAEILSLNRAAHVLTRSGSVLDKLLKMNQVKACETLIRDYELSSAMVLVKREHVVIEEGFKKIEGIDGKKMAGDVDKTVKVNTENVHPDHKEDEHHHTTNDPVRIALFCRNVGRVPRIGRVVRMVESEADHEEKYIIELIK